MAGMYHVLDDTAWEWIKAAMKLLCKTLEVKLAPNDTRKQKDKDTENFLYPCPHLGCSAAVTDSWNIDNWKEEGKCPVSLYVQYLLCPVSMLCHGVFSDSRESDPKQHGKPGRQGSSQAAVTLIDGNEIWLYALVLPLMHFTYPDAANLE